jgi:hypothetical protein
MERLDNLIAGTIGMALIIAFLIGLADSINAIPFWFITIGVLLLGLYNYYESCIKKNGTNK